MSFYHRIYKYFDKRILRDALLLTIFIAYNSYLISMIEHEKPIEEYHKEVYGDLTYGVFCEDRLADYNGIKEKNLYLAVLGSVFNVSKSPQHYAKGGSYHYFVGK